MARLTLAPKLKQAVDQFKKSHPQYGTKQGATDRCREASSKFCAALRVAGFATAVVDEIDVVNNVAHKAVFLDGIWFDWTARQFRPDAPFPLIVKD